MVEGNLWDTVCRIGSFRQCNRDAKLLGSVFIHFWLCISSDTIFFTHFNQDQFVETRNSLQLLNQIICRMEAFLSFTGQKLFEELILLAMNIEVEHMLHLCFWQLFSTEEEVFFIFVSIHSTVHRPATKQFYYICCCYCSMKIFWLGKLVFAS